MTLECVVCKHANDVDVQIRDMTDVTCERCGTLLRVVQMPISLRDEAREQYEEHECER